MSETKSKRGRKKKGEQQTDVIIPNKPSKRGRKAKVIDFKKTNDFFPEFKMEETTIIHLPIELDILLEKSFKQFSISEILSETNIVTRPYNKTNDINTFNKTFNNTELNKNIIKNKKEVYKCTDKHGLPKTIITYNDTILPTELDSNNLEKIKCLKTNVACWWCCHSFDNYPLFLPISFNEKTDIFKVSGCFCSFNCVKAYSFSKKNLVSVNLLYLMYKILIGKKYTIIKRAPDIHILQMFGGPISIEEYRQSFINLTTYNVNIFPMVFLPIQIEEHKVENMIKESINRISITKKDISLSQKSVNSAVKRLSTNKKSFDNSNTLTNMMGIKIK